MNLSEYKRVHRGQSVTKDIRDRWSSRVTTNHWDTMGRRGAEYYLDRYGRNIGVAKLIKLAVYATIRGAPQFAEVMWEKAFEKEHPGVPFHSMDQDITGSARELPDIFHT